MKRNTLVKGMNTLAITNALTHENNSVTIGKELGEGNFAIVYHGRCGAIEVAVKILKIEDAAAIKIYEQEKKIMAIISECQADDPNEHVVKFFGCAKREPILVMEYLPGGDLIKNICEGDITMQESYQIAADVANGLAFLHKHNIIHCDLKPDNILLTQTQSDKTKRAKIADFGFAKLEEDLEQKQMLIEGTPDYCAPEILTSGYYSKKSDVYAKGMTDFILFTRSAPYDNDIPDSKIIRSVIQGKRPTIPDDCPSSIKKLITHCWMQDPDSRPTAQETVEYLDEEMKKTFKY
ncbi:MAG: hypothetical protein EPO11_00630 [Gammaproteobacteria bacterium]|nr:MAG: hypothetical protein EPO11_00630 [Gammaproteobacteria bacterium]